MTVVENLKTILNKAPKIDIVLNNLATPTEVASTLLFIQTLKNLNKDYTLYIPMGIKLKYMQDLIQKFNTKYQTEIKPIPFIVEIQGGASKVKDLRVDIKDGKLIVYLIPNKQDFSTKDIKLIEGKMTSEYLFVFGFNSIEEIQEKTGITLQPSNNSSRFFIRHDTQIVNTKNLMDTASYVDILKLATKHVPNNQVPYLWKILFTYIILGNYDLNYKIDSPLGYESLKDLRRWVQSLKVDKNTVLGYSKYHKIYDFTDIHPEINTLELISNIDYLINIVEINGYKLAKIIGKVKLNHLDNIYKLRGNTYYLETIIVDEVTFINDILLRLKNSKNTPGGYIKTDTKTNQNTLTANTTEANQNIQEKLGKSLLEKIPTSPTLPTNEVTDETQNQDAQNTNSTDATNKEDQNNKDGANAPTPDITSPFNTDKDLSTTTTNHNNDENKDSTGKAPNYELLAQELQSLMNNN